MNMLMIWMLPIYFAGCVTSSFISKPGELHIVGSKNLTLSFDEFIKKFNKVYEDEAEYTRRFKIFRDNMRKIEKFTKEEKGTATYSITKFSDMEDKEYGRLLGYKKSPSKAQIARIEDIDVTDVPEEWDWRKKNAVTAVEDQLYCGSCWDFSAVGTVESQWAINKGQLIELSKQQLLDCDKLGNNCEGGNIYQAYEDIISMGGLEAEKDYPYLGVKSTCNFNDKRIKATISSYHNLTQDEQKIAAWVYRRGPVSIVLNDEALRYYQQGIIRPTPDNCSPDLLNHATLIVGFGVETEGEEKIPYWIVKNSWGIDWGEQGYFRIYRGDNSCGMAEYVSTAIV
ncbi:hypothetical protein RUM43_009794 [Polyplax serrata]|uniref:Uncharacterized protein n=1 Tax=Polyplax serrata TaxID=468196 RepID=A0AAN8Q3Y5_POLSC